MALPPPTPTKPETIRRGGFQFDGMFTTIDGVAFERPQYLLRLCYPGEPDKWKIKAGRGRPPKMEKITDFEAAHTLSRKFVLAQFRFYGLPPPYQSSSDEVLALFREQVAAGHFRRMAPDVEALRDAMAREWEARRDASAAAGRPRGRPKGSVRKTDDQLPPATVVGAYVVSSKELHERWLVSGSLTLDVAPTATPGVYRGTFHFGVIFGVMFLSADEKLLATHIRRVDAGDDPDSRNGSGGGGGGGGEEDTLTGNKRKQPPPSGPSSHGGAGDRGGDMQHQQQHPQQQFMMPVEKKPRIGDGSSEMPGMEGHPDMRRMGPGAMRGLGGLGPLMGGSPGTGGGMMYGGPPPGSHPDTGYSDSQPVSHDGGGGVVGGAGSKVDNESSAGTGPGADTAGGAGLSAGASASASTGTNGHDGHGYGGGGRPPLKFYVRWRGRGRADKHAQTGEHRGTLKFTNKHYTKFAGEMDLAFLGADEITGKRVSNVPTLSGEVWSDYLETVYDWTRGAAAGGWN